MEPYQIGKGGGSAYGGNYKPAKPEDERFIGKPGEIKITYAKDGSKIETHIGPMARPIRSDTTTDAQTHIHTASPTIMR